MPLVKMVCQVQLGSIPTSESKLCGRCCINSLRPRQDGRHFADDSFTCIFFNENCCILIKFSLKYVRKGPIDNNRALVQIMAWRRSGDKPFYETMIISLPTHICVTRPQWVKERINFTCIKKWSDFARCWWPHSSAHYGFGKTIG